MPAFFPLKQGYILTGQPTTKQSVKYEQLTPAFWYGCQEMSLT